MSTALSLKKSHCLFNMDLSVRNTTDLQNDDGKTSLTLRLAASRIIHGDCSAARELLKTIIAENVENPQIYNLFGISFECDGDKSKASRFYRVSYYMDQTFQAAADNLARICEYKYGEDIAYIAWGIDMRGIK